MEEIQCNALVSDFHSNGALRRLADFSSRRMWSCWSHIDSCRRKNSTSPASSVKRARWLVESLVNHPTFPTEVCWATQQDIAPRSRFSCPFCAAQFTYHLRTFSMAARTFLMSSLARLRVSARPDRPDILIPLWFIYRCIWNFKPRSSQRDKSRDTWTSSFSVILRFCAQSCTDNVSYSVFEVRGIVLNVSGNNKIRTKLCTWHKKDQWFPQINNLWPRIS